MRRIGSAILIVRFPDGLQLAVPEWMLSPQVCQRLTDQLEPRIAIEALEELRRLIDAQTLVFGRDAGSGAESSAGGNHAQRRETGHSPADASVRRQRDGAHFPSRYGKAVEAFGASCWQASWRLANGGKMSEKIKAHHLERCAYVYGSAVDALPGAQPSGGPTERAKQLGFRNDRRRLGSLRRRDARTAWLWPTVPC